MVEYIYFVKCMDCEDEPFDFFDEAKEFALSNMSKKPEIHQTEVVRNDFGECTDSTDYGKVWSWDEVMLDIPEDTDTVFSKSETFGDIDTEFDNLDNSLNSEERIAVPDGMTIDGLVEAMEENEEMIECKRCQELFPKEDMLYELSRGYLCPICIMDLDAAGEDLEFRPREIPEKVVDEEPLVEAQRRLSTKYDIFEDEIVLYYNDLEALIQYNQTAADAWDEKEFYSEMFEYKVPIEDAIAELWDCCIDDRAYKEFYDHYDEFEADESKWINFAKANIKTLMSKYSKHLFDRFESDAQEKFQDEVWEEWNDGYLESIKEPAGDINLLETLEEPEDYKKRLTICPECGETSFDRDTQICINCGFNVTN